MLFVMEILKPTGGNELRKLMLLAAMLAMVLVAAAPALAQNTQTQYQNADVDGDENLTQQQAAQIVQDCRTILNNQYGEIGGDVDITGAECQAIINQVQAGDDALGAVNAVNGGVDEVVEDDAVEDDVVEDDVVEEEVVLAPAEDAIDNDEDGVVDEADGTEVEVVETNAVDDDEDGAVDEDGELVVVVAEEEVVDEDAAVLPDTGGASLFTLGAGALLVGGGLLARRIFS